MYIVNVHPPHVHPHIYIHAHVYAFFVHPL